MERVQKLSNYQSPLESTLIIYLFFHLLINIYSFIVQVVIHLCVVLT
jgi:hypothetical protein